MDENVQHEITLACIVLLQKNAEDDQKARKRNVLHEPKSKREAIELLLKAAGEPAITFENITDALWIVSKRSKPAFTDKAVGDAIVVRSAPARRYYRQ